MKNMDMDNFHYAKEAIMCYHQINTLLLNKDEWNTKEDADKSLKNTLYVLWYAKKHLSGWSDIEQQWNFLLTD